MSKTEDFSNYPLPEALTRRVVSYLNIFRLLVSSALLYALFADLVSIPNNFVSRFTAYGVLITYLLIAIALLAVGKYGEIRAFYLALVSLVTDIVILSILLFIFGGLEAKSRFY